MFWGLVHCLGFIHHTAALTHVVMTGAVPPCMGGVRVAGVHDPAQVRFTVAGHLCQLSGVHAWQLCASIPALSCCELLHLAAACAANCSPQLHAAAHGVPGAVRPVTEGTL